MKEQQDLHSILKILASFPNGASSEEIRKALQWALNQTRTLQRRLADLVQEGRILAQGTARTKRYRLSHHEVEMALSSASEAIRKKVRRPLHLRPPVGYHRAFLDKYRPNKTFYLTELERKHLLEIGESNGDLPAGTQAKKILNRLLIDLSWNSSRLEGNTYSLLETEKLLKFSEAAKGKDLKEAQMILNHKDAIEFLVDSAREIGINRRTILNLHAILSYDLLGDPQASGRLRTIPVGIAKSVYTPPSVPQLINDCFQQILDTAHQIQNPFEQAFFLMVQLPYLQPFEDVNKRVSRLAANIPLILHNLSPLSFVDVPVQTYIEGLLGVYELRSYALLRDVFIWAYERSCNLYSARRHEIGEPDPFRIFHRDQIRQTVIQIVQTPMNRTDAVQFIQKTAREHVPKGAQAKFIEIVESEIMALHEGNFARYRLNFHEYLKWRAQWV